MAGVNGIENSLHLSPLQSIYGEEQATLAIRELAILEGSLPNRAAALVLEWASLHQGDLLINWNLCQQKAQPTRIDPLP